MMSIAPGEAHTVVKSLGKWAKKKRGHQEGAYVKAAWVATGAHDAIAMLEADTNEQLMGLVSDIVKKQQVKGQHCCSWPILGTQTAMITDGMWG